MKECLSKRFAFVCACVLYFPALLMANTVEKNWQGRLQAQLLMHPDIVAAKELMNAELHRAEGANSALYNPELSTEIEKEGSDNNYLVGISQTLDWQDKQTTRQQLASVNRITARQSYELSVMRKTAAALRLFVKWEGLARTAKLTEQQESQLDTLLGLIKQRQQTGDLAQIDAELAILGLSQRLSSAANVQSSLIQIEAQLRESLPGKLSEITKIPNDFWGRVFEMKTTNNPGQVLMSHPKLLLAKAAWETQQQNLSLATKQRTADPTIGINAGESADERVIGLSLSIPLNIRNDFSADIKAERQLALSAEATYHSVRRQQKIAIDSAAAVMQQYQQRFDRWQKLMQGRDEKREALLKKQWRSGDLSTAEYLMALQQINDGISAGIELQTQYRLACIEWLLQTGQVSIALAQ